MTVGRAAGSDVIITMFYDDDVVSRKAIELCIVRYRRPRCSCLVLTIVGGNSICGGGDLLSLP